MTKYVKGISVDGRNMSNVYVNKKEICKNYQKVNGGIKEVSKQC